jgi:hypothetical protein
MHGFLSIFRWRLAPLLTGSVLSGIVTLWGSVAHAYCLTTTCDTQMESCDVDSDGCSADGIPLTWSSLCLYFGVQQDGSDRRQISASTVSNLMEDSFDAWMNADCGSGTPPFVVQSVGEIECDQPEFNCDSADHNDNTVMFRDEVWHYDPAALAITTLTVDVRDGTILDADMEVNSLGFNFSVGDGLVNNDLLSVLTHESGHFLGLSHSNVDGSTMYPGYSSRETTQRTLDPDDIAGICEIFPPDQSNLSCAPPSARNSECVGGSECRDSAKTRQAESCTLSLAPSAAPSSGLPWLALLGLALLRLRRRSKIALGNKMPLSFRTHTSSLVQPVRHY